MNPHTAHGYALLMPCVSLCFKKGKRGNTRKRAMRRKLKSQGKSEFAW